MVDYEQYFSKEVLYTFQDREANERDPKIHERDRWGLSTVHAKGVTSQMSST